MSGEGKTSFRKAAPPCSTCLVSPITGFENRSPADIQIPINLFLKASDHIKGCFKVDKATKTQISIVSFVIGLIMLFVPYLKNFDSVIPGISQYFSLMFYLGLLLIIVGYYLK